MLLLSPSQVTTKTAQGPRNLGPAGLASINSLLGNWTHRSCAALLIPFWCRLVKISFNQSKLNKISQENSETKTTKSEQQALTLISVSVPRAWSCRTTLSLGQQTTIPWVVDLTVGGSQSNEHTPQIYNPCSFVKKITPMWGWRSSLLYHKFSMFSWGNRESQN